MATSNGYASADLAFIHDDGFHSYARESAPTILRLLHERGIDKGLVVDLGSGTGRFARELHGAGYKCAGFDQSAHMVRFARKAAPAARFKVSSLFDAKLPACDAVTSMSECLNYRFGGSSKAALLRLFKNVHAALRPGGVFIFDIATPSRAPRKTPRVVRREGDGWAIVSVTTPIPNGLRRSMVYFRRHGELYRRGAEEHELTLYPASDILTWLRQTGFKPRRLPDAGFPSVPGMAWFAAQKP
jgi:SAM-dependent methyltransferase